MKSRKGKDNKSTDKLKELDLSLSVFASDKKRQAGVATYPAGIGAKIRLITLAAIGRASLSNPSDDINIYFQCTIELVL